MRERAILPLVEAYEGAELLSPVRPDGSWLPSILLGYRPGRRQSGGSAYAWTRQPRLVARGARAPPGAEKGPWRCHPLWKRAAARLQGYARGGRRPVARFSDGTLGIKADKRVIRTPNHGHI
jgi:hypothetical protein